MNQFISKIDKEFDMLKFAEKQLLAKEITYCDSFFKIGKTYSQITDNLEIYPKTLTGAECDEITGEIFSLINPKHKGYMKYGATKLLMAVYGDNKERAKNRALRLIEHEYEDKKETPGEQEQEVQYLCDQNGTKLKIYENLNTLLKKNNISVALNELTKEIEIKGQINVDGSYDASITKLNTLCQLEGLNLNKDQRYDFMYCIAYENKFNLVLDYLSYCKDKYLKMAPSEPIVNELFKAIKYLPGKDVAFFNKILLKWLICCVHIANNNGLHFIDFMPILKGKQGLGKTAFIASLFPKKYLNSLFKDGVMLKLGKVDSVKQSTKYWVAELGEFGKSLKENDRDEMKAFLGRKFDEYRVPYARSEVKHPRRTAFIGTINDEEFLRDPTGNRRYVVYDLIEIDYKHSIDVDLLWGEVALMYEGGEYLTYLTSEEQEINDKYNQDYIVRSNEQILLEDYIPFNQPKKEWRYITSSAIAEYLNAECSVKIRDIRYIGRALKTMGFEQEHIRVDGKLGRYYMLPFIKDYSMPI